MLVVKNKLKLVAANIIEDVKHTNYNLHSKFKIDLEGLSKLELQTLKRALEDPMSSLIVETKQ